MITHRNASLQEVQTVVDWAADEGWNPGLDDAAAFFAAGSDGFYVAVDKSDGPVAAISVVNHSDQFAFLGLYIVHPDYRGTGIGLNLWRHAVARAGMRTIGLDGVEAQQANYVASGFAHAGGTTRFSGSVPGLCDAGIQDLGPDDIPALIAKEAAASGVAKPAYLRAWFQPAEHRKTLVMREDGAIAGFCTVRACRSGAKIGPLSADTPDIARQLIRHAASIFPGDVTLDVPESATSLAALCQRLGLSPGFKTARMYRGAFTAAAPAIFAVTSLELG